MAQFELLDTLLKESGHTETYGESTDIEESVTSEIMYADLDMMVETAMRESLRNTVMESDFDSDTKLQHLSLVEGSDFTEEQILNYMKEDLDPVVSHYMEETAHITSEDTIMAVTLPLYEMVGILEALANDEFEGSVEGNLYESIVNGPVTAETSVQEAFVTVIEDYELDEETFNSAFEVAKDIVKEGIKVVPSMEELIYVHEAVAGLEEAPLSSRWRAFKHGALPRLKGEAGRKAKGAKETMKSGMKKAGEKAGEAKAAIGKKLGAAKAAVGKSLTTNKENITKYKQRMKAAERPTKRLTGTIGKEAAKDREKAAKLSATKRMLKTVGKGTAALGTVGAAGYAANKAVKEEAILKNFKEAIAQAEEAHTSQFEKAALKEATKWEAKLED